jgi:arsenate reductase (thioredoxin)
MSASRERLAAARSALEASERRPGRGLCSALTARLLVAGGRSVAFLTSLDEPYAPSGAHGSASTNLQAQNAERTKRGVRRGSAAPPAAQVDRADRVLVGELVEHLADELGDVPLVVAEVVEQRLKRGPRDLELRRGEVEPVGDLVRSDEVELFFGLGHAGEKVPYVGGRWVRPRSRAARSCVDVDGAPEMARILFVCLHNAGRSQMSEALFNRAADGRHEAESAGTSPAPRVHPGVVEVMREHGLDLEGRTPRSLDRAAAERADVVVTMGCGDECPYIPGRRYLDWDLPDPQGKSPDEVRAIRDEIDQRVCALVAELDGDVRPWT